MNKLILAFAFAVAAVCVGFFFLAPAPVPESIMAAPKIPAAWNESQPAVAPKFVPAAATTPAPKADAPTAPIVSESTRPTVAVRNFESKRTGPPVRAAAAPPAAQGNARAIPATTTDLSDDREANTAQSPQVSQTPRSQPNVPPAVQSTVPAAPLPAVVELEVPAGGKLPLALVESGETLSDGQLAAVDATATDFVRSVVSAAPGSGGISKNPNELWSRARRQADERYRLLFGNQAADQAAARAAAEATATAPAQAR